MNIQKIYQKKNPKFNSRYKTKIRKNGKKMKIFLYEFKKNY